MKQPIVILCLITLLIGGCKKYPEDDVFIHLRSARKRLVYYQPWSISEYTINNIDSIPHLNAQFWWQAPITQLKFHFKDAISDGSMKFTDKRKKIIWGNSYFIPELTEWEIIELDHSKFKLKTSKNSKNYYLSFISVK